MRADKSARRFRLGLLLYALLLLLIAGAALTLLQRYLSVYEATRPTVALEEYRAALLSPESTEGCRAALADLDPSLRAPEDSLALVREQLEDVRFVESISESSESEKHYRVVAGGQVLGELTLSAGEERGFGLRGWRTSEDHYDFSAQFHGVSAVVPPGYQVFVGEHRLGRDELRESGVPYERLADAYSLIDGLPTLLRYESGLYLGELPLRVLDGTGREVPPERQSEEHYLDNCSEEDRAAIEEYVERFLRPYILFTANIDQERDGYFTQILALSLPGSSLRQRLQESIRGEWWSWVRSCELQESEITGCTDLGDGRFLVDIRYTTRVVAISDPVVESFRIRMVLDNTSGKLLGSFLYNR
ncbi:MAG: hypothetical protein J6P58_04235 [Oscillospiraceae bacterium]|nr:hypothetical protein [Oscillospiraceae bacterium]